VTTTGCPGGFTYAADRTLTANTANMTDLGEAVNFIATVSALADRVSNVGGESFDFIAPYGLATSPFTWGANGDGLNEIGIADLSLLAGGGAAAPLSWGATVYQEPACEILETDIAMDDDTVTWYVPSYYGIAYYDAAARAMPGLSFGRGPLLHEIFQGMGLRHNSTTYSFMNAGVFPWANRSTEDHMVDPLPEDREFLRDIYPGTAVETDVGVLTTWFDSGGDDLLCKPSTGTGFSPSIFDATCGVDATGAPGATDVCPGDQLYVRYALVNYGNTDVSLDEELWFSQDDVLNRSSGLDIASSKVVAAHVAPANRSSRWGRQYKVPSGLAWDTDYYPIIWLDTAGITERSTQNNWIPLRAPVHVKPQASCP
jgi:hypothetical protein